MVKQGKIAVSQHADIRKYRISFIGFAVFNLVAYGVAHTVKNIQSLCVKFAQRLRGAVPRGIVVSRGCNEQKAVFIYCYV